MASITLAGVSFDIADFADRGYLDNVTVDGVSYPRLLALFAAALSDLGEALVTTSASSHSIGTGSKTFTLAADRPFAEGGFVLVAQTSNPANYMHGQITDKTGTTLVVNVLSTGGAGGPFTDWTVMLSGPTGAQGATGAPGVSPAEATDTQVRTGTDAAAFVSSRRLYTANAPVALADGTTITPDLASGRNFSVTLAGNRTLANPTSIIPGQSGKIRIAQDATGGRTLTFGSYYKRPNGTLTLSTAANAVDHLWYFVESATEIVVTLTKAHS